MSLFDELKGKAGELKDQASGLLHENSGKITEAIDTAGDFIDEKTGGKFAEHVDKAQDGAKGLLHRTDGPDTPAA